MVQKPPLQQLSPNNHGPAVVVASLIFCIVALSTVITRLLTRFKVSRRLAGDDYLILLSMITNIAQTSALIIACNHGLGRHKDDIADLSFTIYAKATYASDMLLVLTVASAKASVAFLIKSLDPSKGIIRACQATLIFTGMWVLSSIIVTAFQCQLPTPWKIDGRCINLFAVDVYNATLNILTDVMLVIIPLVLMLNVQLPPKKRWLVIALFASRLIVIPVQIVAIVTRRHAFLSSSDLTWDLVAPTIWLQGMIALSIMTACLPSIRRFLADLRSGMTGIRISEPLEKTKNTSSTGSRHNSKSYATTDTAASRKDIKRSLPSMVKSIVTTIEDEPELSERERFNPGRNVRSKTTIEKTDSVEALQNNVILHTIDYEVTYHDAPYDQRSKSSFGSTSSRSQPLNARSYHSSWQLPERV